MTAASRTSVAVGIATSTASPDRRIAALLKRHILRHASLVRRLPEARPIGLVAVTAEGLPPDADAYLIVVGSADARDDAPLDDAVRAFVGNWSHDRLLLVAGDETLNGFPATVRERQGRNGETSWLSEIYTPKVTSGGRTRRKLLRDAALRLLAEICGCDYDDLARRRVARRRRQIASLAVAVAVLAMAAGAAWLWGRTPQSQQRQLLGEVSDQEVLALDDPAAIAQWALALHHAGESNRSAAIWRVLLHDAWQMPAPVEIEIASKLDAAGRTSEAQRLWADARSTLSNQVTEQNWFEFAPALSNAGEHAAAAAIAMQYAGGDRWNGNTDFQRSIAIDLLVADGRFQEALALARREDKTWQQESYAERIASAAARSVQPAALEELLREFPSIAKRETDTFAMLMEAVAPSRASAIWVYAIDVARALPVVERCIALDDIAASLDLVGRPATAARLHDEVRRDAPAAAVAVHLPTVAAVREERAAFDAARAEGRWDPRPTAVAQAMAIAPILADAGQTAAAETIWATARQTLAALDHDAGRVLSRQLEWSLAGTNRRSGEPVGAVPGESLCRDPGNAPRELAASRGPSPSLHFRVRRQPHEAAAAIVRAIRCPAAAMRAIPYVRALDEIDLEAASEVIRAAARQAQTIAAPAERCSTALSLAQTAASAQAAVELRLASAGCPAATRVRVAAALVISVSHHLSKEGLHENDFPPNP
jgi:hypothetical protein